MMIALMEWCPTAVHIVHPVVGIVASGYRRGEAPWTTDYLSRPVHTI
jgi:hypothetical protein